MKLNYTEVTDTIIGRFVGCALMADLEGLRTTDMENVDISIIINGKEVDFQEVFTAFERSVVKPTTQDFVEKVTERISDIQRSINAALDADVENLQRKRDMVAEELSSLLSKFGPTGIDFGETFTLIERAQEVVNSAQSSV